MKQTAVEWLVEQLFKTNNNTNDAKKIDVKSIIQQAKEMEKQQQGYSEEEVLKLLIYCKNRFGGSGLEDYTHDDEVEEWFEQFKKK